MMSQIVIHFHCCAIDGPSSVEMDSLEGTCFLLALKWVNRLHQDEKGHEGGDDYDDVVDVDVDVACLLLQSLEWMMKIVQQKYQLEWK